MIKDSHEHDLSSKLIKNNVKKDVKDYKHRISLLKKLSSILALIVVVFTILIMVGWIINIPFLRGDFFIFYASKFNTALFLFLLGLSLILLNLTQFNKKLKIISSMLAFLVLVLTVITLIEYLVGINIGIDQFFYTQPVIAQNELFIGRLKLLTSLTLISLSSALLLETLKKNLYLIQSLSLMGGFIAFYGLIINLYGVQLNHIGDFYLQMGFYTAIISILLTAGILFYRPEKALMGIMTSPHSGGKLSRLLISNIIIILFIIGFLNILGRNYGLFSSNSGTALVIISSSIITFLLIIISSYNINKLDLNQEKAFSIVKDLEEFYKSIIESLNEAIFITNEEDEVIYFNAAFKHITGIEDFNLSGSEFKSLTKNNSNFSQYYSQAKNTLKPTYFETIPLYQQNDKYFTGWILPEIKNGKFNGSIFTLIDDTERKSASDKIQNSLKEKETLIKEIHHRVKNNLQIISSLLNLQSMYVADEKDSELFQKAQNRVKSMALIHAKLYQSDNLSEINFKEYIETLSQELVSSYQIGSKINLKLDVEDILMNLETAIPCGLIITELVTNSLKYAFPDKQKGDINIILKEKDSGVLTLIVSDNGVGISEDIDLDKTETLGLELVNMLVKQLEGSIKLDKTQGTKFIMEFKALHYPERV